MATIAELISKSESAVLSEAEARELHDLLNAENDERTRAKKALKAAGILFPSDKDSALMVATCEDAQFLLNMERAYNVAKLASVTNTYNDMAEKYRYTFCENPAEVLALMEKHYPADTVSAAKDRIRTRWASYPGWRKAINNRANLDAARKSGKVYRAVTTD